MKDLEFDEYDLIASVCRESFYEFVKEFWDTVVPDKPVWNWHIEYLCNQLQIVAERVFYNLKKLYDIIINIAPGMTKSIICSIMLPAWIWTRMPSAGIIGGSYAHPLSMTLSLKNRDIILSEKYQRCFGYRFNKEKEKKEEWVKIRSDQSAKSHFDTTRKGSRIAVGVGGAVTGMHGDFLIVDDPVNPNEAISELELKSANHWMSETLPTRKRDKERTVTILIMQRLHQNDCTAHMIEWIKKAARNEGVKPRLKHINLPAELSDRVNPPELKEYYVDGLMDPIRLNRSILIEQHAALGEYGYAGQFLQHPAPPGGGMFKVERILIDEPTNKWTERVRYWDKAGTHNAGCYTVGLLMGRHRDNPYYWIMDVIRGQWESGRRERIIKHAAEIDGRIIDVMVEQEPGSGGKESAENTARNLAGHKVILDRPTGDKITRADPFSVQVNYGNVRMVKGPWNRDFIAELEYYPRSQYKDQVDCASGAFNRLARKRIRVGGWG